MPGPSRAANLDHAIKLYLAGKPIQQITAACGIDGSTLNRERNRRGVPSRKERALPIAEIVAAYERGASASDLARKHGVARGTIEVRLRRAGIALRDVGDATRLWMEREPEESRAKRIVAAAEGCRTSEHRKALSERLSGIVRDEEQLARRALLREQAAAQDPFYKPISDEERQFSAWLTDRGEQPVAQKAVGRYNLDLAIAPVAVEILGGGWHSSKRQHAIRTPKILNAGWHLVFVWNRYISDGGWHRMIPEAADYVVALAEQVRREPTTVGQYRVITGDGQLMSSGSAEDDEFAVIPPPRRRLDARS